MSPFALFVTILVTLGALFGVFYGLMKVDQVPWGTRPVWSKRVFVALPIIYLFTSVTCLCSFLLTLRVVENLPGIICLIASVLNVRRLALALQSGLVPGNVS